MEESQVAELIKISNKLKPNILFLLSICLYGEEAPLYVKTITGKPYMVYFKEELIVAKKLGINLKYDFTGCSVMAREKHTESKENKKADAYYRLKLGENWKTILREETEAKIKMR